MHICLILLIFFLSLNKVGERQGLDGGDFTIGSGSLEEVSLLGKLGCALEVYLNTSLLGLGLGSLVVLLSLQDLLLALGGADVFNSDMDTLFDNSSIYQLVDTNTDGGLGDIEDNSGSSVVSLVGHTLVDGRIGKDVDVVTNLNLHEVLGKVDGTMLPKLLGKHVSRTRSCSE